MTKFRSFEDAAFESQFAEDYERARVQAERLARKHRARLRALGMRGLAPAAAAKVRAKLEEAYKADIEALLVPLRGALLRQRDSIERRQKEAAQKRAQRLVEATKDVSQAALEIFRAQVERMTAAERLEAYRNGEPWQRLVIATWYRPEPKAVEGHLPEPLEAEERELAKLIAEGDRVVRYDDELARLGSLEGELRRLDPVGYHRELEQRFKLSEPQADFEPAELEWANADVSRAIARLQEAGEL